MSADTFRKLADRIVDKQTNAHVDRLANELHQAYRRGRKEARREVRETLYGLGRVDNAARLLLLAINQGGDLTEAAEQMARALALSPTAIATPYPLSYVVMPMQKATR